MRFRRQRRLEASIDLINLVDVVVLVLIFFMVSTTFTSDTRMELVLPEAEATRKTDPEARLEVIISVAGSYSVNGKALINDRIETIMAALRAESAGDNTRPLVITADAKATHESVVRAMDAAGRLGFSRLNITTRSPETPP